MRLLQRCAITVASSPRKYILWPAMMAFVLSYTTIYSLFSQNLPHAPVPQCIDPGSAEHPGLYIRQALICPPEFKHAMDKDIINGLEPLRALDKEGLVVSPITADIDTSASSVLYAPKYKDGKVVGAKGLLVSYMYEQESKSESWEREIDRLVGGGFDIARFNSSTLFSSNYKDAIPSDFNFFPNCPLPIFTIILIYSAGALYMGIVFSDTNSVLSQIGLAVTLAVETTLAIFAALTTTSLYFPFFSHYNLRPFVALPLIVAAVSTENMFRLVNAISKTPPENNPLSRISVATSLSAPVSIRKSLTDCAMISIGLIPGLGLSQHARALCLFMVLGLIFDLCLHLTFFTAVLSVDLRRLELQDLISAPTQEPLQFEESVDDFKLYFKTFFYYWRIYMNQALPALTALVIYGSVLIYLWLLSQGYISQPQAMTNPSGMFAYFLSPLSSKLAAMDANILVYEPVVLYASQDGFSLGMPLHGALTPTISDFLSMNLFVEFVASFALILSMTWVVLRNILPTSIEIPDIQEISETLKFFSKDLVGYYTLDILQLVIEGSWIGTVSLDHKVYIWHASQSKELMPTSVPLPSEFWPISKMALGSGCVAIFSPAAGLFVWDFKTRTTRFSLAIGNPIEAFYNDNNLIVVTNSSVVTIDTIDGNMTSRELPLVQAAAKLDAGQLVIITKANKLLVVSPNAIRSLAIRESISAMSRADRAPYTALLNQAQPKLPPGSKSPETVTTTRPYELARINCILPIPELQMVLIVSSNTLSASILDVHTGTVLRHLQIGSFKPGSIRVFHSLPTYCRFCGSNSVESISVAYTDAETDGLVICHTLSIENRARNNICLRSERDPRETRCLGFEATTEDQHWINNVEGWDTTEMNMIMGVRRKEERVSNSDDDNEGQPWTSSIVSVTTGATMTRRKPSGKPPLHITWEGWAMSANGQVSYYDIPDVQSTGKHSAFNRRLLIQGLGPVVKYGRKSIAVSFGNVIKILYFGNEESFLSDVEDSLPHAKNWKRSASFVPF